MEGGSHVTDMAANVYPSGLVGRQNLPEKTKAHCSWTGLLSRKTESRGISGAKESMVDHCVKTGGHSSLPMQK